MFYNAFSCEESFFLEVCDVLDVQLILNEDETLSELYDICTGRLSNMCICQEKKGGLIGIRNVPLFLMIKEKDDKFCVQFCERS